MTTGLDMQTHDSRQRDRIPAPHGPAANHRRVNPDISLVVLHGRAKDVRVFGKSPWASVVMTQRNVGRTTSMRTSLPIRIVRPTQSFSMNPSVDPAQSITKFGRKRATSKRLFGASAASRSSVAVVTR